MRRGVRAQVRGRRALAHALPDCAGDAAALWVSSPAETLFSLRLVRAARARAPAPALVSQSSAPQLLHDLRAADVSRGAAGSWPERLQAEGGDARDIEAAFKAMTEV